MGGEEVEDVEEEGEVGAAGYEGVLLNREWMWRCEGEQEGEGRKTDERSVGRKVEVGRGQRGLQIEAE